MNRVEPLLFANPIATAAVARELVEELATALGSLPPQIIVLPLKDVSLSILYSPSKADCRHIFVRLPNLMEEGLLGFCVMGLSNQLALQKVLKSSSKSAATKAVNGPLLHIIARPLSWYVPPVFSAEMLQVALQAWCEQLGLESAEREGEPAMEDYVDSMNGGELPAPYNQSFYKL